MYKALPFQWIPNYYDIAGNETANKLAKKRQPFSYCLKEAKEQRNWNTCNGLFEPLTKFNAKIENNAIPTSEKTKNWSTFFQIGTKKA